MKMKKQISFMEFICPSHLMSYPGFHKEFCDKTSFLLLKYNTSGFDVRL